MNNEQKRTGLVGAPYGNKNAEKWSFKKAVKLFHEAIELTERKKEHLVDIAKNIELTERKPIKITCYDFDFIGEIASELGTFHKIFDHLTERFPILQRLKNQLYNNIERNCYYNTKKGAIREATGIVNLKSNWKWTDRSENRVDVSEDMKVYLKPFKEKKVDE
jgi:hypothetical protein